MNLIAPNVCLHTLFINTACRDLDMSLPTVTELASLTTVTSMLSKIDLKSGFLHIPLRHHNRRLYWFRWLDHLFELTVTGALNLQPQCSRGYRE